MKNNNSLTNNIRNFRHGTEPLVRPIEDLNILPGIPGNSWFWVGHFESEGHNGNTYRCTVESLAKGTGLNTYDDGTILLVIMKDTVEVGETYIIGFSPVEENSRVHMQTTVNGVFEDSSELLNDISERTGK